MSSPTKDETIFDALKNPMGELGNLEQDYLGPDYKYYKKIKNPSQLGMSSKGSFKQIGRDIRGLIDYVEVLVSGRSRAQTKRTPLGDRFFLKTGAQCKDTDGKLQNRWIYIDNIPDGDIPIISSALDYNFTEFEGLVPGAISKMGDLNPTNFMKAFVTGSEPPCRKATLSTVDVNDNSSFDTQYLSDFDIKDINPCNFRNKTNPITNKKCREGFQKMSLDDLERVFNIDNGETKDTNNSFSAFTEKTYYITITILLLFLMVKLLSSRQ